MRDRPIDVFTHLDEHISYSEEYGTLFDTPFVEAVEDVLQILKNGVTVQEWISVNDRLPENEKDVLIRAERKLYGIGKRGSKIASVISMAFHTDGKMNTEQSAYTWETEYLDAEYDEEADAYIIPEGWWESVTYSEAFSAVCDVVTHWMPLPQPPKGE